MKSIHIIYISLSGNTTDFIKRLSSYIAHSFNRQVETLNIKELNGENFDVNYSYVSFLPTYLEGGNGIENGYQEILTGNLKRFIAYHDNANFCYGIIGSGNRNFNKQYCLTAHQYAKIFNFPVLDEFELRGTPEDIERIASKIIETENQFQTEVKND